MEIVDCQLIFNQTKKRKKKIPNEGDLAVLKLGSNKCGFVILS
jgi:hypothetical protein